MKKLVIAVAILVMVCVGASSVAATSHGAAGPKIYWTASGLFDPMSVPKAHQPRKREKKVCIEYWFFRKCTIVKEVIPDHEHPHSCETLSCWFEPWRPVPDKRPTIPLSLSVKLYNTDTVLLTQDTVWVKENLEGHLAGLNYSILHYTNSLNRIKMIRDIENAQLWLDNSMEQYEAMGEKWYQ